MRKLGACAALAGLATVALAAAAGQIKVTPVSPADGRVLASFSAADSWTIETRELLQFGQVVAFDYYVELIRPRTLWVDSVLAETNVRAEAKFDTLTGTYQVSRQRDGNMQKSEKRSQENEVRDWLTIFESVELVPTTPLKANTDYYIQVRLLKSPRRSMTLWSLLPFGSEDSSGRAPFTYLRLP
jgi:hypothetical protein